MLMDFMLHYYTQNDDNHRRMMPNNLVVHRRDRFDQGGGEWTVVETDGGLSIAWR